MPGIQKQVLFICIEICKLEKMWNLQIGSTSMRISPGVILEYNCWYVLWPRQISSINITLFIGLTSILYWKVMLETLQISSKHFSTPNQSLPYLRLVIWGNPPRSSGCETKQFVLTHFHKTLRMTMVPIFFSEKNADPKEISKNQVSMRPSIELRMGPMPEMVHEKSPFSDLKRAWWI